MRKGRRNGYALAWSELASSYGRSTLRSATIRRSDPFRKEPRADRMGCAASGLGLIAWALGRRRPAGLGAGALGGWLLYQGWQNGQNRLPPSTLA